YPLAYETYKTMPKDLGAVSYAFVKKAQNNNLVIANAITQEFYGYDGKKYVSYDAIYDSFTTIKDNVIQINEKHNGGFKELYQIHFPKIGAGLGGGDWDIIHSMITSIFYPY